MVLKLYGDKRATCTKRVAIILHEKKVPFELHHVDLFKGEQKSPEHRKYQPFGKVPYIDDEGFILYESRAIGRYIATKYVSQGTLGLIPSDLKKQALFEQAVSVETSNFEPDASEATYAILLRKYQGLAPDLDKFKSHIDALSTKLDVYDQILSKQKYLAGDSLTLADLFHIPVAARLFEAGSDIMLQKPNVARKVLFFLLNNVIPYCEGYRWYNDISSRPAWEAVKNNAESTISYE